MAGWAWIIIGICLCTAELLVVSGFFLFLLGLSAVVVGLIVLSGLFPTWSAQAAIFSAISLLTWILFSKDLKRLLRRSAGGASWDTKGKTITVSQALEPNQVGAGELWGSTWRLKNIGDATITPGTECVVVDAEGVTLSVVAKK